MPPLPEPSSRIMCGWAASSMALRTAKPSFSFIRSRIDGPTITARVPRSPSCLTMSGTSASAAQTMARSGTTLVGRCGYARPARSATVSLPQRRQSGRRIRLRRDCAAPLRRISPAHPVRQPRRSNAGETGIRDYGLSWRSRIKIMLVSPPFRRGNEALHESIRALPIRVNCFRWRVQGRIRLRLFLEGFLGPKTRATARPT